MSPRNQRKRKSVQIGKYDESDEISEEEEDEYSDKLARRGNRVKHRSKPKLNNNPSSEEEDDVPLSRRKRGPPRHQGGSDSPARKPVKASHPTEESEEVDTDSPSEKKQKSNSRKLVPKKRKRKANARAASAESDRSDSSDAGRKQNIGRAKKRKRRRKRSPDASDGEFVSQTVRSGGKGRVSTGRVRTEVRYNDELEDSELEDLLTAEKDEEDEEVEEVDIDCIEKVLDHREGKVGATGEMTKHFAVLDNGDPNTTLQTTELGTERSFRRNVSF